MEVDWNYVACGKDKWSASVNTEMNRWVPKNTGNFLTTSFSRTTLFHGGREVFVCEITYSMEQSTS
jgi:hypothetical protein